MRPRAVHGHVFVHCLHWVHVCAAFNTHRLSRVNSNITSVSYPASRQHKLLVLSFHLTMLIYIMCKRTTTSALKDNCQHSNTPTGVHHMRTTTVWKLDTSAWLRHASSSASNTVHSGLVIWDCASEHITLRLSSQCSSQNPQNSSMYPWNYKSRTFSK